MIEARRPAVPAPLFALGAIASVQVGATVARHLFPFLGPTATVFVRVGFGALILLAIARPGLRRLSFAQWREVVPFGLILGAINLCLLQLRWSAWRRDRRLAQSGRFCLGIDGRGRCGDPVLDRRERHATRRHLCAGGG